MKHLLLQLNSTYKAYMAIMIVAICVSSINLSCKKFLDAKSNDKFTTPTTLADLQAMMDNSEKMNNKSPSYDEASADDYFLTPENFARLNIRAQQAYVWEQNPNEHPNDWGRLSETVYGTNVCLETAEKLINSGTPRQELNNVIGSALFYRAFAWLKQSWIYCQTYDESSAKTDLGIVIRKISDINMPSKRSDLETVYSQIIGDLKQAIELLPNTQLHVLRPTKAAAYALLARTYLSMRKYEQTLQNAEKCLAIKSDLIDYNTINTTNTAPFQSYNPEVIFHAEISSYSYFNIQATYGTVDSTLYTSYNQNDLRKSVFFAPTGKYNYFKGTYLSRALGSGSTFTGLATDEVYLMKAECLARKGNADEAMATLNILMKKRWKSTVPFPAVVASSSADALAIVLRERRKELLFRGLRWMDIKRLNKEGYQISLRRILAGTPYTLEPNSIKFALPIPMDIIQLTGIPQNPGWQ